MGVRLQDIREILVLNNTYGGETYIVDGRKTCFRPLSELGKEDQFCSHVAGYGTEHLHEGRCKFHSGRLAIRSVSSGRYAPKLKRKLREQYAEFSSDPDILNLLPELVLQRTLLANQIEEYQDEFNQKTLITALRLLNDIGGTVERIEKIHSQKILTAATARLMMAEALNVIKEFVPESVMGPFIRAWKQKVLHRFSFLPTNTELYEEEEL